MSLKNIFQKPIDYEGIGKVYPIQMKDWDEFESHLQILMLSDIHFENSDGSLLLRKLVAMGLQNIDIIIGLQNIFNLVSRTSSFKIKFEGDVFLFLNDEGQFINEFIYDDLRKIVLHQNLLIEPKVFKNKTMQEWAEKVLASRNKNSANVSIEDMITTVAALSSKHYNDLEDYSIYQLKSEFYRHKHIKHYESIANAYGNPYAASEVDLPEFAKDLELYADPYRDIFKSDSNMNIKKALK